ILIGLAVVGYVRDQHPFPPYLGFADLVPLLVVPFCWGAVTGLTLVTWAYEPPRIRRLFERVMLFLIVLYLVTGVVVGEKLFLWIGVLPESWRPVVGHGFLALHLYNPFGVLQYWM